MPPASPPPEPPEPRLSEPLDSARDKLLARVETGQAIYAEATRATEMSAVKKCEMDRYSWHEYNQALLRRILGPGADEVYRSVLRLSRVSSQSARLQVVKEDLEHYVRQLESIIARLPLWTPSEPAEAGTREIPAGPVFVVHGRALGRAQEVARVLERSLSDDVIILHEQPNDGLTILEKFERHAASAKFAVVILTGDDEGRLRGTEDPLLARGRQNVIFEMGFFFAQLGRARVVVLVDEGVEQPSDVHGLLYIPLDPAGAWKGKMAKEMTSAGLAVDLSEIIR